MTIKASIPVWLHPAPTESNAEPVACPHGCVTQEEHDAHQTKDEPVAWVVYAGDERMKAFDTEEQAGDWARLELLHGSNYIYHIRTAYLPHPAPTEPKTEPVAWLCELMQEDGSVRSQIVTEDPDGLRWNDIGEPSPFRVTPLYTHHAPTEPERRAELTDEELRDIAASTKDAFFFKTYWGLIEPFARAVLAAAEKKEEA